MTCRWRYVNPVLTTLPAPSGLRAGLGGLTSYFADDSAILVGGNGQRSPSPLIDQPFGYDYVGPYPDWAQKGSPFTTTPSRGNYFLTACWDEANDEIVAFGGKVFGDSVNALTWTYNGAWTLKSPATSPPARSACLMSYCPALGAVVMTGGVTNGSGSAGSGLADTWKWDGTTWTQLFPAHQPERAYSTLCKLGSDVYFFGGQDMTQRDTSGPIPLADTWKFNGTDWTQLSPAHSPAARSYPWLAPWPDRSAIVYVLNGSSTIRLFNGTDWSSESTICGPPTNSPTLDTQPTNWDGMAYLPRNGKILLHLNNAQTWELINDAGATCTTAAATDTDCSNATLNATVVVPPEEFADVYFDYGPTIAYGTTTSPVTVTEGSNSVAVSISGLTPGDTYHFRARALTNGVCPEAIGADASFTEGACDDNPTLNTSFAL